MIQPQGKVWSSDHTKKYQIFYNTDTAEISCTCPGYGFRRTCKHSEYWARKYPTLQGSGTGRTEPDLRPKPKRWRQAEHILMTRAVAYHTLAESRLAYDAYQQAQYRKSLLKRGKRARKTSL